jgi:hypothetical protein
MDQDDDVEHLFSWLQTPELRYREFAGAREITDTVVTWQPRANTPSAEVAPVEIPEPAPLYAAEEPVAAPIVPYEPVVTRGPATIAPMPMPAAEREIAPEPGSPFALGAAGRTALYRAETEMPAPPPPPPMPSRPVVAPPPVMPPPAAVAPLAPPPSSIAPAPAPMMPPTSVAPAPPPPPVAQPAPPPRPAPAPSGGGLLGGAYRENGGSSSEPPPADSQQRQHSLDAVFSRLSAGRLPDPRDRLRHIPGVGPPPGRPR